MKGLLVICLLAAPAAAKPTGVLDFDLSEKGSAWVLSDDAFSLSFPGKPSVEMADQQAAGMTVHTMAATYIAGNDVFGFFAVPVPKGVEYDVKAGIKGARDGALGKIHGTVVSDEDTTMAGLKGKHTVGTATLQGTKFRLDIYVVWDEAHRTLLGGFTANNTNAPSAADLDFIASCKTNPKGRSPH